jgi:carbamoyl-phosphate synthase large subunit
VVSRLLDRNVIHVLITGVGAPGVRGTIYALRNHSDTCSVRITGVDVRPDVVGRFLVDRFYSIPAPEDPAYLESLAGICREETVDVVIPQTTREVNVLSRHLDSVSHLGIQVMVSNWPAIEIANNKWRLLQEFEQIGLPVPKCKLARSEAELKAFADGLGYPRRPVAIKPPFSNGMRGVRVLKQDAWDVQRFLREKPSGLEVSLSELIAILKRGPQWPELLVMEYLPGPEYSVDVFAGTDTQVAIPRLRKSVRSGITFEAVMEFREDLIRYSLQAVRHIGLRYAVGFQYKLDEDGVPRVLECNPRVQGTMVASLFSGVNVIWLAVKELLGEPLRESPQELKEALFYRFWGGVGVCQERVNEI